MVGSKLTYAKAHERALKYEHKVRKNRTAGLTIREYFKEG